MKKISKSWIAEMDALSTQGIPFFCLVKFNGDGIVFRMDEIPPEIDFKFHQAATLGPKPIVQYTNGDFSAYQSAFSKAQQAFSYGDSYLLNATFSTPIQVDASLETIFEVANASYRVLWRDKFVCFSPETFLKIVDNELMTFPMKGTQKTAIGEENGLLKNEKERSEQFTITDLMRNDLSMVADNVQVKSFQDKLSFNVGTSELHQTFSAIAGQLKPQYSLKIGSILAKLLPAGSISGAPKPSTLDWINSIETHDRGFYTGVCGHFDGSTFDSGIMIRFIEQTEEGLIYKSGGGLTAQSTLEEEYQEVYDKIYIP